MTGDRNSLGAMYLVVLNRCDGTDLTAYTRSQEDAVDLLRHLVRPFAAVFKSGTVFDPADSGGKKRAYEWAA